MCEYMITKQSRVRLNPELASYDQDTVHDIIDRSKMCHVAVQSSDGPYIQASAHWRVGNKIYVHGAVKNKMLQSLLQNPDACLSFTIFDGYVYARSGFNHAVLYQSVVAYSQGKQITDDLEKLKLLEHYIEYIEPGRWASIRQPSPNELKMTGIVEFELKEVSAKILTLDLAKEILPGGSMEAEEDAAYDPWSGVVKYAHHKEAVAHDSL